MKMELPGKKPTHDFLSLYTHPSSISEPRPSQGNYLKTHDFLGTGEKTVETNEVDKPIDSPPSSSVEHILPGGIGTYTIRHIPNFNQRPPKTEQPGYTLISADKNIEAIKPNTTSKGVGPGSFRLWGDSGTKDKGVTVAHAPIDKPVIREAATVENLGQWSSERSLPTHPLPPFIHRSTATTTTATSSSFTNSRSSSKQKNQSFMEMMKSGRGLQEDEEDDEEEFLSKKTTPSSSNKDGKSGEQRANTPRSKHSATEQRRRSKINDRFQILRDLIPQNDQKRDKASFLLEVIDYIKFLQEKVNKYETSYQGWNQEPTKLTPWRNGHAPVDTIVDPPRVINSVPVPALVYTGKFDDNNITDSPAMLIGAQNLVEPDLSTVTANKGMEHHPGLESKGFPVPLPLQPNMVSPFGRIGGLAQPPHQPMSDAENMALHPQPHLWQDGLCADDCPMTSDAMHEQEVLPMEGGTISISDVYSQGLLNNLTQALQSSGVDLSQANISVQVDYGKRAINRLTTTTSGVKNEHDEPASNQAMLLSKFEGNGEDSDQARKRPRVG